MADTTFVDYTTPAVNAEWLNEINNHVWNDIPVQGITLHAANKIGFVQSGTGAVARTAHDKLLEFVSAKDFGAVGDGVTDDTGAMLAFAAASAGRKFIPPGRYKITQMLSFQPGDVVEGAGASSVIDASAAGTWPYAAVIRVAGELTQIADLAINAVIGDDVITLTSATEVSVGDALIIYNPTVKSWSTWRDEYKAGEFVRVHSISGANVRAMNSLYDSYTTTTVDVYRLDGATTVS